MTGTDDSSPEAELRIIRYLLQSLPEGQQRKAEIDWLLETTCTPDFRVLLSEKLVASVVHPDPV